MTASIGGGRRILVTGGAGYLGSVLSPLLLERGYAVRCLDRLYFGQAPIESLLRDDRFELHRANLADLVDAHEAREEGSPSELERVLEGVDGVIHLAGLANDPSCELDRELTERTNITATRGLGQVARAMRIERFVFASSCSVYGAAADSIVDEESPCRPVSVYAESKVASELDLDALAAEPDGDDPGFTPVYLRQATLFGYSPRMRFDLAVNLMTLHGVSKGRILVLGGGQQWRPFLHTRDAARAFIAAFEAPAEAVRKVRLNVGCDAENYKIIDLARAIAERLAKPENRDRGWEVEVEVAPEDDDKRSYHVAFERIGEVLGWKPEVTVRDGAEEIAQAIEDGKLPDPETTSVYWNIRTLKDALAVPAVDDGEPVRSSFLPFALPLLGREEEEEVVATLRSGWITTGPRTARLEKLIADYTGAKHAVCVNSCTAALHLSLVAAGVGRDDEVITSPITWPSTANVIVHQGAKPVFVDVEPDTFNMDPDRLEAAITDRTRAIVPVHMAGQPVDLDRIGAIAAARGIPVIEDAAHALGARYRERPIGSISKATCFSFYPIKNITTGEGGCVTTDDDEWAETLRVHALHGISRDAWKRYRQDASETSIHWECVAPGFKYNMPDLSAAIGIHQMGRLEGFIDRRRRIARRYDRAFQNVPEVVIPRVDDDIRHARHLYIIMVRPEMLSIDRDRLVLALKAEGIGTGIHFRSLHVQPWYRETFGFAPDAFPNAAMVSERIISLPLYPKMDDRDVETVIRAVRKLVDAYRK